MNTSLSHVIIHTDGSCLGNPGRGGWAAKLVCDGKTKLLSGGFSLTTNNRMEIYAAIMALEALRRPCRIDLYTDSRYLCDAVEKRWLYGWIKRGWIKADKKPVLNRDLWQRLLPAMKRHDLSLHWVEAHAGHADNEEVDTLARQCAAQGGLPLDEGFMAQKTA